jgi:hypothetical protein
MADDVERIYEGWDELERVVRANVPRGIVAYLRLIDRTNRRDDPIGRFDVLDEDAAVRPPTSFELDAQPAAAPSVPFVNDSPAGAVEAALTWLRRRMDAHTVGEPMRKFQVRLMGVKGGSSVDSAQVVVRNPAIESEPVDPVLPALGNEVKDRPRGAIGDAFYELALSWQSQIRLLPTGYRDVFDRLFRMLELYEKRCDRYERTITNLTDELGRRDERIRKIEAGASAETVKVQARAEVARTAFSELALAGRMLLGTKAGLSPEAISVLSAVDKSPELRATLSDPKVVAMLNKPENLKTLALLLQQGAQVDAAPQADSPADPSPNPAAAPAA